MAAPRAAAPRPRRLGCFLTGLLGCGGFVSGALVAAAVFAPRLLGGWLTGLVEAQLEDSVDGRLQLGRFDLAWTRPVRLRDLRVLDRDGRELLTASLRMPSLLDIALADEGDELDFLLDVRQADLVLEEDGRWNVERVLAPLFEEGRPADGGVRWSGEATLGRDLADLGLVQALRVELQTRGDVRVSTPQGAWRVDTLRGRLAAGARGLQLSLDLAAPGTGQREGEELTLVVVGDLERDGAGELRSAELTARGAAWPAPWLDAWLPGLGSEVLGSLDAIELGLESRDGRAGDLRARLEGRGGRFELEGRLVEGELVLGPQGLRYAGRPVRGGLVLPGDLRASLPVEADLELTGGELSWRPDGIRPRTGSLSFGPLALLAPDGSVLVPATDWRLAFGDGPGASIVELQADPGSGHLYVQVVAPAAVPWEPENVLVRADGLLVPGLDGQGAPTWPGSWAGRWLGPSLDFFLEGKREGDGWDLTGWATGELGRLDVSGRLLGDRLRSAGPGQIVLEGEPARMRHAAVRLLPLYERLEPLAEPGPLRLVLGDYDLPAGWLADGPAAWDWSVARADVRLELPACLAVPVDGLLVELGADPLELAGTLDLRVAGGALLFEDLPLELARRRHGFSGRVELADGRLDLEGTGPLSLVLGRGRGVAAASIPVHLGGSLAAPRVDLPLRTEEFSRALEGGLQGLLGAPAGRALMRAALPPVDEPVRPGSEPARAPFPGRPAPPGAEDPERDG